MSMTFAKKICEGRAPRRSQRGEETGADRSSRVRRSRKPPAGRFRRHCDRAWIPKSSSNSYVASAAYQRQGPETTATASTSCPVRTPSPGRSRKRWAMRPAPVMSWQTGPARIAGIPEDPGEPLEPIDSAAVKVDRLDHRFQLESGLASADEVSEVERMP